MCHGCYLWVGGMDGDGGSPSCCFTVCLHTLLEGDGGGCSPPFMLPHCVLAFTVGGGWWWVILPHSVVLFFHVVVVVSAGGSACCQVKMVGPLITKQRWWSRACSSLCIVRHSHLWTMVEGVIDGGGVLVAIC